MDASDVLENSKLGTIRAPWVRPGLAAPWLEIIAVVFVVIGQSSFVSSWQAWHGSSHNFVTMLMTDGRMLRTVTNEGPLLGVLFIYLHWRGWRPTDLRIHFNWRSTGQGLLLLPGMAIANWVVVGISFLAFYSLQTHYHSVLQFAASLSPRLKFHNLHVSWLTIVPALILNGFFEEITCMGYAFNQFAAKRGPLFGLILTVLLRMSCHTYQGPIHALGIGAAFLVSGLVYWWTRNLWPLILAHILADSISFAAIRFVFG